MLPIVLASFVGAPLTAALLWSHGAAIALVAAPFGASAAGLAVGLAVAAGHRPEHAPAVPRSRRADGPAPTWH